MADIDKMSDEELDAYLAAREAPRKSAPGIVEYAWVLIASGVLGVFASVQLLIAELELKADPYANLACDVNELLACSTFLTSWEGSILGFSNSYLGIAGFTAMLLLGIYLLVKKSLPTVMWVGVAVASGVGFLALLWFQYVSFIESGTLCPWCLAIWAALIPFIVQSVAQARANLGRGTSRLWTYRWAIIAAWFLAVIVFAAIYFWDTWMWIFGWD